MAIFIIPILMSLCAYFKTALPILVMTYLGLCLVYWYGKKLPEINIKSKKGLFIVLSYLFISIVVLVDIIINKSMTQYLDYSFLLIILAPYLLVQGVMDFFTSTVYRMVSYPYIICTIILIINPNNLTDFADYKMVAILIITLVTLNLLKLFGTGDVYTVSITSLIQIALNQSMIDVLICMILSCMMFVIIAPILHKEKRKPFLPYYSFTVLGLLIFNLLM